MPSRSWLLLPLLPSACFGRVDEGRLPPFLHVSPPAISRPVARRRLDAAWLERDDYVAVTHRVPQELAELQMELRKATGRSAPIKTDDGFLLGFVNALNNQTFAREQSSAGCNMATAPLGNVSDLRVAWKRFGLRGFIGLEWGHNIWKQKPGEAYGQRWDGVERSALMPDWEQNLHELIESAAPEIKNGTCLGVFLGDEVCECGVPFSNLTSVADAAKAHLQKIGRGIVMTNEGNRPMNDSFNDQIWYMPSVPSSIDVISMDFGYASKDDQLLPGRIERLATEPARVEAAYKQMVYPKLSAHQRVALVPPLYADLNVSRAGPIEAQVQASARMLAAFFEWSQRDDRVTGLNAWPWHDTLPRQGKKPHYMWTYGARSMPHTRAELRKIGKAITPLRTDDIGALHYSCNVFTAKCEVSDASNLTLAQCTEACTCKRPACAPYVCTKATSSKIMGCVHASVNGWVGVSLAECQSKCFNGYSCNQTSGKCEEAPGVYTSATKAQCEQLCGASCPAPPPPTEMATPAIEPDSPIAVKAGPKLPRGHLKIMNWYDQCGGPPRLTDTLHATAPETRSIVFPGGPPCTLNTFATQAPWNNVISGSSDWTMAALPAMAKLHEQWPHLTGLADLTHAFDSPEMKAKCANFTHIGCRFFQTAPECKNGAPTAKWPCNGTAKLLDGWQTVIEKVVSVYTPYIENGTILGVWIGDELVGSGSWTYEMMDTLSRKLRELLGSEAFLYTNEDDNLDAWPTVPAGFSHISYDDYDNHNTNGTTELERQWEYVHGVIIPRLHPGQRVLLVPGLFASDPLHCLLHDNVTCPLDKQEEQVLEKIKGYIAWMKADVMIAGFKGWHLQNYAEGTRSTFGQMIGAIAMPSVMDELIGLGRYIVNDVAEPDIPVSVRETLAPLTGPADPALQPYLDAFSEGETVQSLSAVPAWSQLVGAHTYQDQALLGDAVIVVRARGEATVFLPTGTPSEGGAGWMEMNHARTRMTWSGGIHSECPADTLKFPNASKYFSFCKHTHPPTSATASGQYTHYARGNFTTQSNSDGLSAPAGGLDEFAKQMYVREGSIIPMALTGGGLALKVFPGLCPGILWKPTQFGGPRVVTCLNRSAIGGDAQCPVYGRFPCSGRVLYGGRLVNMSQSRTYDTNSQAMVIAVTLEPAPSGTAATPDAPPMLHFMHTSQPAVRNVTVSAAGMPAVSLDDGCWWLARQGPWWLVVVNSSVALSGGATVSVYMW